ncbi:hypothetical protein [Nocardiopsis halotolerans]|uniref:hypothetical protein n=1 Tax=Nocardiopsis halotolerans TaxID=124252 RepID=UPI0003499F1B|nr:hypothetical protein [Nocardiopsis halotolerans]
MAPHTPETIAPRRRDPSVPTAADEAPPLTPQDLVPHLRGLAHALRGGGADQAARDGVSSP